VLVDRSAPDPHSQTHAGGIEGGASTRSRRPQAKDMARCFGFGVSFGTVHKQVGAAAPEK